MERHVDADALLLGITGNRPLEDEYLSTLIGAVKMMRKGCTAVCDLDFEPPAPTSEGLEAIVRARPRASPRPALALPCATRNVRELPTDRHRRVGPHAGSRTRSRPSFETVAGFGQRGRAPVPGATPTGGLAR